MNEKRVTSRDIYYLLRRPTRFAEKDNVNGMSRLVKFKHPEIERQFNSDGEPHFAISTGFISSYIDGINCELFYRNNAWNITDFGNSRFAFGAYTIASTSKSDDLKRFREYVQSMAGVFNIRYNSKYQRYFIRFKTLRSLQKAFYSMINFEIIYTSVMGFIAQ